MKKKKAKKTSVQTKSLNNDFPYLLLDIKDKLEHEEYDDAIYCILELIRKIYENKADK